MIWWYINTDDGFIVIITKIQNQYELHLNILKRSMLAVQWDDGFHFHVHPVGLV